jgi:hypothetical protein
MTLLTRFQPLVGSADFENLLFLGEGAEATGAPVDINEAARVEWITLNSVRDRHQPTGRGNEEASEPHRTKSS